MNRLQRAMNAADETEVEAAAVAAVMDALNADAQQSPALAAMAQSFQQTAAQSFQQQTLAQSQRDVEAAAQRQRDLDAALADVVEIVARHRARLGRRVCSRSDGAVVRQMFDLLRCMGEIGADADPSFQ